MIFSSWVRVRLRVWEGPSLHVIARTEMIPCFTGQTAILDQGDCVGPSALALKP